uniref:LEM domain-containing protein n=1 Tax=Neolamprologus brichardi TaxID=32507 RepID=A0A3Q4GH61_NEOBR
MATILDKGLTDKELRSRLVELGESPGPISSRTRPTYMRRLCRLVQESNSEEGTVWGEKFREGERLTRANPSLRNKTSSPEARKKSFKTPATLHLVEPSVSWAPCPYS